MNSTSRLHKLALPPGCRFVLISKSRRLEQITGEDLHFLNLDFPLLATEGIELTINLMGVERLHLFCMFNILSDTVWALSVFKSRGSTVGIFAHQK